MNIGIVDIKNKKIGKFDLNFDDNVEINMPDPAKK